MKKILKLITIFCVVTSVTSCNKDSSESTPFATSDVYIKTIKRDNKVVHGLVAYSISVHEYPLLDVKVTSPSGNIIQLKSYAQNPYSFEYSPKTIEEYSETKPTEGVYSFDVKFQSEQIVTSENTLSDETLDIPEIDSISFKDNYTAMVYCEEVSNANGYLLQFEQGDKIYAATKVLKVSTTDESGKNQGISLELTSDEAKALNDKNITLSVNAILYESSNIGSYLQAESESSFSTQWKTGETVVVNKTL